MVVVSLLAEAEGETCFLLFFTEFKSRGLLKQLEDRVWQPIMCGRLKHSKCLVRLNDDDDEDHDDDDEQSCLNNRRPPPPLLPTAIWALRAQSQWARLAGRRGPSNKWVAPSRSEAEAARVQTNR